MNDMKFFGEWDTKDVKVEDPGLVSYISLSPLLVPKTGARYAKQNFHKSRTPLVERFMNKLNDSWT